MHAAREARRECRIAKSGGVLAVARVPVPPGASVYIWLNVLNTQAQNTEAATPRPTRAYSCNTRRPAPSL